MAMKVSERALPVSRRSSEVDGKQSPPRLQHALHLANALVPCFPRQVMKHHCAQHDIESCVRKRQRFGEPVLEDDLRPGLLCLVACPRNHRRRRIDSVNRACRADAPFGCDCKRACPTAHIQYGLAGLEACRAQQPLTKAALPAKRYQPDQEIVAGGPMHDQAGRAACRISFRRFLQLVPRVLSDRRRPCSLLNTCPIVDSCSDPM